MWQGMGGGASICGLHGEQHQQRWIHDLSCGLAHVGLCCKLAQHCCCLNSTLRCAWPGSACRCALGVQAYSASAAAHSASCSVSAVIQLTPGQLCFCLCCAAMRLYAVSVQAARHVLDACFFFACAVIHSRTLAAVCQHTSSLEDAAADLLGAKSYCGACLHLVGMCTGSAPAAVAQGCPCILAGALHACSGVGALLIRVRQS